MPSIFHQPWWLDIVTGRNWQAIEVSEAGRVVGRLPIFVRRRFGGPTVGMPPLTHFLGPAVDEGAGAPATRWLKRVSLTRALIARLPPLLRFWQKCHRGVTDVVPFQAERFTTQVQFTFEVPPSGEAALWAAMRDKTRNVVRKGRQRYEVLDLADSEEFTRFYQRNLERFGRTDWNGGAVMAPLLAASVARGAGSMLGVRDGAGALAAAIFCPHDAGTCYYSLSSRDPGCGNGAIPLLIWEAMRRAARAGRVFDFDGLSNERVIGMYAGFGGTVRPRYVVHRSVQDRLVRAGKRLAGMGTSTYGS